jgi:hypothetical protein
MIKLYITIRIDGRDKTVKIHGPDDVISSILSAQCKLALFKENNKCLSDLVQGVVYKVSIR